MKRIKKVWEENKVLLVLAIILVVCLIIFAVVAITYFYGSSDSVYGNRLDITKEVTLNDKLLKDIKKELEAKEIVKNASLKLKGKIVYININYVDETKMTDAKKTAEEIVSLFNEDELEVYDLQFTINTLSTSDVVGYTLMGARNANGSDLVIWNNYNIKESSAEE